MIELHYRASYEECTTFSIHIGNPDVQVLPGFKTANAWWHLKNAIKKERETSPLKYKLTVHDPGNPIIQAVANAVLLYLQGYDSEADEDGRIEVVHVATERSKDVPITI